MKNISIKEIKEAKQFLLKQRGYDKETIDSFRSDIREVSVSKGLELGEMLLYRIEKEGRRLEENPAQVKSLILKGANLEFQNERGHRGIHITSEYNLHNIFRYYVLGGADINAQTARGLYTACMICAKSGNDEILSDLILLDALLDLRNVNKTTAIMLAMANSNYTSAMLLREANAILTYKDKDNKDALDLCESEWHSNPKIITAVLSDPFKIIEGHNDKGMALVRKELEDMQAKADRICKK